MTYGKKMTSEIDFNSSWGPVYYTNLLSSMPMLFFSSVVGLLIGWTGWTCRSMVTATSFTLVGVINKFLTILLNVFIWDKHASGSGILALILCLLGGSRYRQAPLRNTGTPSSSNSFNEGKHSQTRHSSTLSQ